MLSSNYSRFDLEQDILKLHSVCDDLDLFLAKYIDDPTPMSEDQVWNAVHGMRTILEMKIDRVMEGMCKVLELNEYCTDPKKLAARDRILNPKKKSKKWNS